jgi:hypothetical protein
MVVVETGWDGLKTGDDDQKENTGILIKVDLF